METFKELSILGYNQHIEKSVEELDSTPFDSIDRIIENALVLKWLRDKHNLLPTIVYEDKTKWKVILWQIVYLEAIKDRFPSYEEAQAHAINRLIEILKTKTT